jgi:hypothetical protein
MGSGKRRVSSNSETLGFDLSSAVMITPLGSPEREREAKFHFQATTQVPGYTSRNVYLSSLVHTRPRFLMPPTNVVVQTTIPHLLATESETPFMFLKRIYIGFITVFCQAVVFLHLHNFLRGCT